MRDVILKQGEQITHSLEVNKDVRVEGEFDSIVLAGLGGSGHPGDLLNALGVVTRPLYVHRNYDLPGQYLQHMGFSRPLVIASSYSGNTEEALSAYGAAKREGLPLLISSSGGKLAEQAAEDGHPVAKIDFPGMQPRHTLFAAFTGVYAALKNSGLADDIIADLTRVAGVLDEKAPGLEASARELALKIKGRVPVYCSSDALGFATKNFKIQTNENAKHPAFWNTFPELNHNEMLGFSMLNEMQNPNQFLALMIRDPHDHPRNAARMTVTRDLYRGWGVAVEEFTAEGETLLERVFYTVTFGMWVTYHLATLYGIDPVPVGGVEDFKAKLTEVAGEL